MWTPYRELIYYMYSGLHDQNINSFSVSDIRKLAERGSSKLLSRSLSADFIHELYEWEDPTQKKPVLILPFTLELNGFLTRPHHRARKALEKLVMAYFSANHTLDETTELAHKDYLSLGDWILPLSKEDLKMFCLYFWDWRRNLRSASYQSIYARTVLDQEYQAIFFGTHTIQDVRIDVGAAPYEDIGTMIFRVASTMGVCAERELRRLTSHGNIIGDPGPFAALAAFIGSLQNVSKAAMDMSSSSGQKDTLQSFMDEKFDDVDQEVLDYSLQEGFIPATPQSLLQLNSTSRLHIDPTKNDLK